MPAQTIIERFHERVRNASRQGRSPPQGWGESLEGHHLEATTGDAVRRVGKALHRPRPRARRQDGPAVGQPARVACRRHRLPVDRRGNGPHLHHELSRPGAPRHRATPTRRSPSSRTPTSSRRCSRSRAELPKLEKVVVFDGYEGDADQDFVMTWDDFLALGDDGRRHSVRRGRHDRVKPEDLATFVYTSGTTGHPKGVMLTHSNIWWTATHSEQHIPIGDAGRRAVRSRYLPLSHIAERMISHLLADLLRHRDVVRGVARHAHRRPAGVQADLLLRRSARVGEVLRGRAGQDGRRPTRTTARRSSPRRRSTLGRKITSSSKRPSRAAARWPTPRSRSVSSCSTRPSTSSCCTRSAQRFGLEECELALSAAAPLSPDLIWFFHSIGIKITEGYGQSRGQRPDVVEPARRDQDRHRRHAASRPRGQDRRGRRDPRPRRQRHGRLLQERRGHARRRSTRTAGSTPATSASSTSTTT